MEGLASQYTWPSLMGVVGLATFLSAVWTPILRELLGLGGRNTLLANLLGGQLFAQVSFALDRGPSWSGAAEAFLVGLVAAATATGLHQTKKQARTTL